MRSAEVGERVHEVGDDVGNLGVSVVLGIDDAGAKFAEQSDESRRLEAVVTHLDGVAQRTAVECVRQ